MRAGIYHGGWGIDYRGSGVEKVVACAIRTCWSRVRGGFGKG